MSDAFPRWPEAWLEEKPIAGEQVLAAAEGLELRTALRGDGHMLFALTWPGGVRWMLIDPIGNDAPVALRAGERPEDGETARMVEGVWSQALEMAKRIIDGDLEAPTAVEAEGQKKKRRWGRG